jgi:transcriptional regulator with XRE-family HTH domain
MATFEEIIETALRRSSLALPPAEDRKRLRQATGIRGDDLARSLNIKPATFYRIERGEQEPRGEVLERLVAFYRAAGFDERRQQMTSPFGLSSPVSSDPPATVCGRTRIEERDLIDLLETLKTAGPEGLTIVVHEKGVVRYGDPNEELYDRATFLDHRGLVTREPHETYDGDVLVKSTITFTITEAGEQALEQATALVGAAA